MSWFDSIQSWKRPSRTSLLRFNAIWVRWLSPCELIWAARPTPAPAQARCADRVTERLQRRGYAARFEAVLSGLPTLRRSGCSTGFTALRRPALRRPAPHSPLGRRKVSQLTLPTGTKFEDSSLIGLSRLLAVFLVLSLQPVRGTSRLLAQQLFCT